MVSILIPIFNEKNYIAKCIESVLLFDLQEEIKEIFLIDGGSTDGTLDIISKYQTSDKRISILHNTKKYQSFALNQGIKYSNGKYIMRLDAHSFYPKNYLQKCIEVMRLTGADNIGGVFVSKLKTGNFQEKIIQAITTHKFGVGNSNYRIKHVSGYAKTVPYGFFNRKVFEKIGLFNEKLIRNQDFEFNRRMIKEGLKIWLDSSIKINYHNQVSFIKFLKKQFIFEGKYNVYMLKIAPYAFTLRHLMTGLFVLTIFFSIIFVQFSLLPIKIIFYSYFSIALLSSISQSLRYKNFIMLLALPFCFFLFHFIHGLSEVIGFLKILVKKSPI